MIIVLSNLQEDIIASRRAAAERKRGGGSGGGHLVCDGAADVAFDDLPLVVCHVV